MKAYYFPAALHQLCAQPLGRISIAKLGQSTPPKIFQEAQSPGRICPVNSRPMFRKNGVINLLQDANLRFGPRVVVGLDCSLPAPDQVIE